MAISKVEIIEAISSMTAMELSDLVKEMETTFEGVSAAAVAVAGPVERAAAAAEEKLNLT